MNSKWRRYEVLLPLQFNDGTPVPGEWLAEAVLEIVENFGAASYETQKVEGHWRHSGILYRDDLIRLVVDIPIQLPIGSGCVLLSKNGKPAWNSLNSGW